MITEKKSIFKPFGTLKYLFRKPHTFCFPFEQKPTAQRYRGLHLNDRESCTGCGNCADICPNQAITMIEQPDIEPAPGKTNELPQIDYGRCCFCGLCVDVCSPGSLSLAKDYIHIAPSPESFLGYLPDTEKSGNEAFVPQSEYSIMKASLAHRLADNAGFVSEMDYSLVDFERISMGIMSAEERKISFIEIVQGFSEAQARREASRCLECGLCEDACPANMGISDYIRAIWEGDNARAVKIFYEKNPLPSICGRICTHKCEEACSVGRRGEPVAIRWLKRFAADSVPAENLKEIVGTRAETKQKKVAIVGAGPAGLSCAYYLAAAGYPTTIFEALPKPGGIMRYGIPDYRLPYDALDKDIGYIQSVGVEIRCNTRVGEDIALDELHQGFDAVFLATGFHVGRSTKIEGTDHDHVFQAIKLLGDITEGKKVTVGEKIVVIGGGDVAIDIARSMVRLQQMKRYAKVDITCCCLESEDIMPATREEIDQAREEGIAICTSRGPDRIEIDSGRIKGLHTVECTSVFDEEGRFNPKFNRQDRRFFEGDMVIEAIGQAPDLSYIPKELDEKLEKEGRRIKVSERFQSSVPWLFVGGDLIEGPDVIHAIANGHTAAEGIADFLKSKS